MITQAESALGATAYSNLQVETGSLSAQFTLQRYGPDWGAHPDTGNSAWAGECFDAIAIGNYLLRAYSDTTSVISAQYLVSEVSGVSDASWTEIDCTAPTAADSTISLSLAAGTGLAARLFFVDTNGNLCYSDCSDITAAAFEAHTVIASPSDSIVQIAAVSTTKCHYITKTSQNNNRLHYIEDSGGWSSTDSDVYWPFKIHGFDACALTDYDVLVMATNLPPLIGSQAVGTEVSLEVNAVQGLVVFREAHDRWSDWLPLDPIDRVPEDFNPARDNVRLSYYNNYLFATYTRAGGDDDYQYSKRAVMRSKDGENWDYPEFLWSIQSPLVVIPRSADYDYLVGVSKTMYSPHCAWSGSTPVELDITNYVVQHQSSAADIRESSVGLADPPTSATTYFAGALDGTLALQDERLQLVYKLGYALSGTPTRIQVSVEDVLKRQRARSMGRLNTTLVSQDFLGRMNRVRADNAFEWPSMQAGRDDYNDPTGTGYGGMRHTANYCGSWKAANGILKLLSSNKQAVAVSTFVTDALNGSAQTAIKFEASGNGEYLGITFHTFDYTHLYYVAYYIDEDKIKLVKKNVNYGDTEATDTVLATSDAMSWEAIDTLYYLKVWVRYGLVYVFTSGDGHTWVALNTGDFSDADHDGAYEMAGDPGVSDYPIEIFTGKFGLIGYGYTADDDWPDWTPTPVPDPEPDPILPEPKIGFVRVGDDKIYRTSNFNTQSPAGPTWSDIAGGLANINRIAVDQHNRYIYAQCSGGLYRAGADSASPAWTEVFDFGSTPSDVGSINERGMAITNDGYVGIMAENPAACDACSSASREDQPVLIMVAPDTSYTVLHLTGCDPATQCCPIHGAASGWAWKDTGYYTAGYWAMGANSDTIRMPALCNAGSDRHHTCYGTPSDTLLQITNENYLGAAGAAQCAHALCDLGSVGLTHSPHSPDISYLYAITYGVDARTDITPANWDGATGHGFDRDAAVPFAVTSDAARVYTSTGGIFTEILDVADLAGSPGRIQHASCYCNDPDQLFVPIDSTPGNADILWTRDGGSTWASRLGNISVSENCAEVRVVWTAAPGDNY